MEFIGICVMKNSLSAIVWYSKYSFMTLKYSQQRRQHENPFELLSYKSILIFLKHSWRHLQINFL